MEGIRIVCPYASCNDCCIVHSISAGTAPELVGGGGGGWSCMLFLHLVLICTHAGPDLCTLHPDLCTLCLWWLSLAATYGGGVSPLVVGTKTPLAHMVVTLVATCTAVVFPSTHWPRYTELALCGGVFLVVVVYTPNILSVHYTHTPTSSFQTYHYFLFVLHIPNLVIVIYITHTSILCSSHALNLQCSLILLA